VSFFFEVAPFSFDSFDSSIFEVRRRTSSNFFLLLRLFSNKKRRPLLQRVLLDPDEFLRRRQVGLPDRPLPDLALAHALRPLAVPRGFLSRTGQAHQRCGQAREGFDVRRRGGPRLARLPHRAPVLELGENEDEHRPGRRADERGDRDEFAQPEKRARQAVDRDRVYPAGHLPKRALRVPLLPDPAQVGDGVDGGPLPHADLHVFEPR
jgi:hypothetical protein